MKKVIILFLFTLVNVSLFAQEYYGDLRYSESRVDSDSYNFSITNVRTNRNLNFRIIYRELNYFRIRHDGGTLSVNYDLYSSEFTDALSNLIISRGGTDPVWRQYASQIANRMTQYVRSNHNPGEDPHLPPPPPPGGGSIVPLPGRSYSIYVGYYLISNDAATSFSVLQRAGFSPQYVTQGPGWWVVLTGVRAAELSQIVVRLEGIGYSRIQIHGN